MIVVDDHNAVVKLQQQVGNFAADMVGARENMETTEVLLNTLLADHEAMEREVRGLRMRLEAHER